MFFHTISPKFLNVVFTVVACGLLFVLACSHGEKKSPVTPDSNSDPMKTGLTFPLFGPNEFIYQCPEEFLDRDSISGGEKRLPIQTNEVVVGGNVSLFSGDFTMSIRNGDPEGAALPVTQVDVFLDDQLVADIADFVDNEVAFPVPSITESTTLRIEFAGECHSRLIVSIEGTVADEVEIIEPDGGVIEIDDPEDPLNGLSLYIPSGAVSDSTLFSIQVDVAPPPPLNSSFVPIVPAADVNSSHGGEFFDQLEITFPISEPPAPEEILIGMFYDEVAETWLVVPTEISDDGQFVTLYTDHLSSYIIYSAGLTDEMIAAVGQLGGLAEILPEVLTEVDEANGGQMRCNVLSTLRSGIYEYSSPHATSLEDYEGFNQETLDRACDYVHGDWETVGLYAVWWSGTSMYDHELNELVDLVTVFANGSDAEAGNRLLTIILTSRCISIAFLSGEVTEETYVDLFATMISSAGAALIDFSIVEYGCHQNPMEGYELIPPGTFIMGSPPDELWRQNGETQHEVTLTNGFFCQTNLVTNQQYMELAQWAYDQGYITATSTTFLDNLDGSVEELVELDSPSCEIDFADGIFTCVNPDHPVKRVYWYGAAAYCDWLSMSQSLPRAYNHATWSCNDGDPYSATGYRLPTEAEWEYACRAGTSTAYYSGPNSQLNCDPIDINLDQVGWYCGNSGGWTHSVGQKMPNNWGLYDMLGNMFEWCNDGYSEYDGDVIDPVGPDTSNARMVRGGAWQADAHDCRVANRRDWYPYWAFQYLGFRVVKTAP